MLNHKIPLTVLTTFGLAFVFPVLAQEDVEQEYNDYYSYDQEEEREYNDYCCYDYCNSQMYYNKDDVQHALDCGLSGIWLPEDPIIFLPFVADPRQLAYSAGWRFNDQALAKNIADVSFYDVLGIYRWFCVWPWGGDMEISIEGAVWAVFDFLEESAPLVNADYYVGVPLGYGYGPWTFRLRGYHISSHIGDEFLLNHPGFDRRNPSAEYLDFFASYYWNDEFRTYGGVGWVVHQDNSFHISPFYAEAGIELHLQRLGFVDYCQNIFGRPYYAMHMRYKSNYKHHVDMTYVLGYEFGKMCGLHRKVRFYMEYHDGYNTDGQFCRKATNYFSLRAEYGF